MADALRVELELELESALHTLGPGRVAVLTDKPIELDGLGYPVIPASTIRGRLRAHLERLLRGLDEPICHPPRPERMCPHAWGRQPAPAEGYCVACRIFGSPWREAGIAAGDLHLVAEQRAAPAETLRQERAGVGISRRLGSAQSERLFFIETSTATGTGGRLRFRGMLEGRLSELEAGWLLAAMPLLSHIGGGKSRGLGQCTLRASALAWWRDGQWNPADPDELLKEVLGDAADPHSA